MTSEAPLPPNSQNWTKLLSFHNSGLSGQLSFGWASWKSLGLNYSIDNHFISNLFPSIGLLCHSWFILGGPHHKVLLIKIAPPPIPGSWGHLRWPRGLLQNLSKSKNFGYKPCMVCSCLKSLKDCQWKNKSHGFFFIFVVLGLLGFMYKILRLGVKGIQGVTKKMDPLINLLL